MNLDTGGRPPVSRLSRGALLDPAPAIDRLNDGARRALRRLDGIVGGPARRHVVAVLAAVLALDSADKATIGASSAQLQQALGIGKTEIGLLLAVSSLVGAVATVPAGVLVDRVTRVRLLRGAVGLWAVAMVASAASPSFVFLLLAQLALGAVTAVAGPAIASLIGDYFPPRDRARVYGMVLSGELVGTGIGFVVAGLLVQLGWRAPFFALAAPAALVVWALRRLPEPARGGPSRLPVGAREIRSDQDIRSGRVEPYPGDSELGEVEPSRAQQQVQRNDVSPVPDLVIDGDPSDWSLWRAAKYVLRVRTNVVLIISSALGYFFFAGVRGFAIEFAKQDYGIGQGMATSLTLILGVGALAGVLTGGRLADRLLERGHLAARVVAAGTAVLLATVLFLPALLASTLALAVPFLVAAAACLGATSPPLDAARLDIMPPRLWGRAEAVRTVLRNSLEALAPVLFGFLAEHVFGGDTGLRDTFIVMLAPLAAAAVLVLVVGRRSYPRDVATVVAST